MAIVDLVGPVLGGNGYLKDSANRALVLNALMWLLCQNSIGSDPRTGGRIA